MRWTGEELSAPTVIFRDSFDDNLPPTSNDANVAPRRKVLSNLSATRRIRRAFSYDSFSYVSPTGSLQASRTGEPASRNHSLLTVSTNVNYSFALPVCVCAA